MGDIDKWAAEQCGVNTNEWEQKITFVYKQTKEMMDEIRPFVRCCCFKKLKPHQAYKCLFCGEWFCKECAELHFGKTVEQYRKEHPIEALKEVQGDEYETDNFNTRREAEDQAIADYESISETGEK